MKEEEAVEKKEASASGAIQDLQKLGAVLGVHYRVSEPDEDITRYTVAFDHGTLVEVIELDSSSTFTAEPGFAGFAIVNADGMQLVGCPGIAATMRSGAIPGEVAYLAVPDE